MGYDLEHINELINTNQLTQDVINKLSKDTDVFIEIYKSLAISQ